MAYGRVIWPFTQVLVAHDIEQAIYGNHVIFEINYNDLASKAFKSRKKTEITTSNTKNQHKAKA